MGERSRRKNENKEFFPKPEGLKFDSPGEVRAKRDTPPWVNGKQTMSSERAKYLSAWQNGYGAFSISPSHKNALIIYIENQREHHKAFSFKEEYRRILRKNNVEFDECYLWD